MGVYGNNFRVGMKKNVLDSMIVLGCTRDQPTVVERLEPGGDATIEELTQVFGMRGSDSAALCWWDRMRGVSLCGR